MKGSLRPHKAGHAGRENVGGACPGAWYSPFRTDFPQMVRMLGREEAIARLRREHSDPDWTPKLLRPGGIQEFVFAVWPQAGSFAIVGRGDRRGVVFTVGARRWHFATHDSDLSKRYDFQADAMDALYEYLSEEN